jgi:hypothetical protein
VAEQAHVKRFNRTLESLQAVADPLQRLEAIHRYINALEELEASTVGAARAGSATWIEIGAIYGLSKQGAQQRFRRLSARATGGVDPVTGT